MLGQKNCWPFYLGGGGTDFFSWVKIRLHTENHCPRLPGSALKVELVVVGGWWSN